MRPPAGPVRAVFFDGETAARHEVTVTIHAWSPPALIIEGEAATLPLRWPLDRLRGLEDQADNDALVVTRVTKTEDETPRDPARLVVTDPALRDWIRASRPNLFRRDLRDGAIPRVLTRAVAALAAFLVILFLLLPSLADTLAALIPPEREAALGRTTIRQFELLFGGGEDGMRCENAESMAAWDALAARFIDESRFDTPLEIVVLDHSMVNAFAAPGGHVVFFRGMIDAIETPEELAAVLAHEIGHVTARDATRLALRSVGSVGVLGLVLGDFAGGGTVLILAEQLLDSSYSREAEAAADAYAFEHLAAQGIDPAALGDLFERLKEQYGDVDGVVSHFVSHPALAERIVAARAAGDGMDLGEPVMTDGEWALLRAICD